MHQHERVILRYTGLSIQIPLESAEIPPEEQKEGLPASGPTIPQIIEGFETLEIPGEQHILRGWIQILQDANRDLPNVTVHGKLSLIREK